MTTIEIAASKGYWYVWLETDSQLVLQAFKSNMVVPWNLKNRCGLIVCLSFKT